MIFLCFVFLSRNLIGFLLIHKKSIEFFQFFALGFFDFNSICFQKKVAMFSISTGFVHLLFLLISIITGSIGFSETELKKMKVNANS